MSGSFGSSSTKTSQKQKASKDPWDVATPYIQDFLSQDVAPQIGSSPITQGMTDAFGQIKDIASQGNPYSGDINALTQNLFSGPAATGAAYGDLERRLGGTADGTNQNLEANPYLRQLLDQSANSAKTAINEQFAAAGRGFSPGHAAATAKAITDAQLPTLANLFQYEQGRSDTAARDLFSGAQQGATTQAQIGNAATDLGTKALESQMWGPNTLLQIEDQLRNLPLDQAAKLAAILFPAGQLGAQTEGSGTGKSNTSGFSLGFNLAK